MAVPLLISVFVIATCGLVYELIAGTLASYLLGDSVTQFSTVIGTYLSAMGVGSYLSKYLRRNLIPLFVKIQLLVGVIGGCSAAFLFLLFEHAYSFRPILYSVVFVIGMLVGLEIPLLMKILKDRLEFHDLISKVLSFDYIGALAASLLFPIVLAPRLGLVRTSFMFGMFNVLVAIWILLLFGKGLRGARYLHIAAVTIMLVLGTGFVYSEKILSLAETAMYPERVIFAKSSLYQRIVVTRENEVLSLYLNGHLQFSSRDEYRYHEALVHVGLSTMSEPRRVLVLGGGDGMAVREVLRYPSVESVTLVDLDREVTTLFSENPLLGDLNNHSLLSPKLHIVHQDAFLWLRENQERFDFVVIDFPDPTNFSLGKLYTTTFYRLLNRALTQGGIIAVQSTSPMFARQSYWCIKRTLEVAGFSTLPYHAYVPSFGEWGFVLASAAPIPNKRTLPADLKFLTPTVIDAMFLFPPDMDELEVEPNKLTNQILVRYYDEEWSRYVS